MACESRRVQRYDGQTILLEGEGGYELGAYLGGGASGVVYEATYMNAKQRVAVKILHPLGFKTARGALDRYTEITDPREDIRWFVHPQTKDVVVTSRDCKELNLLKCAEIWGMNLPSEEMTDAQVVESMRQGRRKGLLPPKYTRFLRQRALIFREIASMRRVSGHRNVLRLDDVLEMIQESKLTFFLVLELASGGELFDRITADEGCDEDVARNYLNQLLQGISYCHSKGVCHRDLKPENLLLTHDGETLKIADFGLSTSVFPDLNGTNTVSSSSNSLKGDPLRRLVSVVGSSHYIAPEVLNKEAYDGTKADAWSIGVILYALLAGSLPFGKELLTCARFLTFSKTLKENSQINGRRFYIGDFESVSALRTTLDWFLPEKLSDEAVMLIVGLLNPDPAARFTVKRALGDVWFRCGNHKIVLDEEEDESNMMDLEIGDKHDSTQDDVDMDEEGDDDDMFEIEVEKPTFTPTPSKQIKSQHMPNARVAQLVRQADGGDLARSAPVRHHMGEKQQSATVSISFTSPPLAPRQSGSPPMVLGGPGTVSDDASSEDGGSYSYQQRGSGLSRPSLASRARNGSIRGFRSRSSSPPPSSRSRHDATEAPIFHEAMKRSTIFTTSVPANQVLERLAKTVAELGDLSSRIDWERFQLEITQNQTGLQLCLVQIFLSRERPGPVYIVEFVRGPEFEIFAFKAFYNQVTQHLASIVRADHMHTLRY